MYQGLYDYLYYRFQQNPVTYVAAKSDHKRVGLEEYIPITVRYGG